MESEKYQVRQRKKEARLVRGARRYNSRIMPRGFMINPIPSTRTMPTRLGGQFHPTIRGFQGEAHAKRVQPTHYPSAGSTSPSRPCIRAKDRDRPPGALWLPAELTGLIPPVSRALAVGGRRTGQTSAPNARPGHLAGSEPCPSHPNAGYPRSKGCTSDAPAMHTGCTTGSRWCIAGTSLVHDPKGGRGASQPLRSGSQLLTPRGQADTTGLGPGRASEVL